MSANNMVGLQSAMVTVGFIMAGSFDFKFKMRVPPRGGYAASAWL